MSKSIINILFILIINLSTIHGFTQIQRNSNNNIRQIGTTVRHANPLGGFFQELDNFMDDAFARRLGNGATFYGKRKSSFYGEEDKMKKENSRILDPLEDYQGPSTGNFKWKYDDETGKLKPVSVMKGNDVGRNPQFWDKYYEKIAQKDE